MKEKNPGDDAGEDSNIIVERLTTLQNEFAQLSELDEMEHNYAKKLVESLKLLQSQVEVAIPLQRESLGPAYSTAKEVYLVSECTLVIVGEDDIRRSVPLVNLEPKYVLEIAKEATPGLSMVISEKRREASTRVDIFERVLKEVKKAGNIARQTERALPPAAGDDLVQSAMTTG